MKPNGKPMRDRPPRQPKQPRLEWPGGVVPEWAEVVTRVSDTHVPDKAFTEARAAFTEKQLADLTIAVGLINAYNRLAISFRATPLSATAPAAA